MKNKTFVLLLILCINSIFYSSCKKENCDVGLADLTGSFARSFTRTYIVGLPTKIPIIIKNASHTSNGCETIKAKSCKGRLEVYFDKENNGMYSQNVTNKTFDIPELASGDTTIVSCYIEFDKSGNYCLNIILDIHNQVPEDNESNNQSNMCM